MLSRVAERVYWMARYLERAEKTARLINVHTALLMDLPGRMEINWYTLIRLFNADSLFREHYQRGDETSIMLFLIADRNNPASLASSLANVRENVRTSLDVLPEEIWEQANQIHLLMTDSLPRIADRYNRQIFLREVMKHCQCIRGALDSHMSRDHSFDFMQIGKHLERADMSSRILEMTSLLLSEGRSDTLRKYDGIVWTNLLQALSARQMYLQHIHSRVEGQRVMRFLLNDDVFPGSIGYCLSAMGRRMRYLPDPELAATMAQRIFEHLQAHDLSTIPAEQVHTLMDYLQVELGVLHGEIAKTWFYPDHVGQQQSQG
ncbi:MAG TPA: alpha-E domain-containing protein [Candidatus Thiothrix moscowensis]|uniref:alpha-E domain-containing protein n=1 Tax=unclassified Thiothrix TaxID=2636184 RepID=UPI0025DA26EB|nr:MULTISPECIES: alpha-E domain-containing protein [unclassified Thiothrix]HRJ53867.1 alpha-E domain-containing protein [Candidatus Thiothrix moscowensis]HRJ93949.1 alpha-E domain-containing protein [Candidatus Thiothrix moscowensis]